MEQMFTLLAFLATSIVVYKGWRSRFRDIDKDGYSYRVVFNHLDKVPDFANHEDLQAMITVIRQQGNTYIVQSKTNDVKLRE